MDQHSTVVGLDVHKETITAAILPRNAARPDKTLTIDNHAKAIERLVKPLLRTGETPVFVYEAGPCGYTVQRQLHHLGCHAAVIAPALTPTLPTTSA
jgi:transposase